MDNVVSFKLNGIKSAAGKLPWDNKAITKR